MSYLQLALQNIVDTNCDRSFFIRSVEEEDSFVAEFLELGFKDKLDLEYYSDESEFGFFYVSQKDKRSKEDTKDYFKSSRYQR